MTLLVAAGLLAFGIWRGRADLGQRGFIGVMLTSLLTTLLGAFLALGPINSGGVNGIGKLVLGGALMSYLGGALPLWVAGHWFRVIKQSTEPQ